MTPVPYVPPWLLFPLHSSASEPSSELKPVKSSPKKTSQQLEAEEEDNDPRRR